MLLENPYTELKIAGSTVSAFVDFLSSKGKETSFYPEVEKLAATVLRHRKAVSQLIDKYSKIL